MKDGCGGCRGDWSPIANQKTECLLLSSRHDYVESEVRIRE